MISLMFALLAVPAMVETQAVQATLQSCALESGRYVCRYAVPDIVIVPIPGSDIVTEAPAAILGAALTVEAPSPGTMPPAPTVTEPSAPPVAAPVDPGPVRAIDTGVLSEREARLVSRCADAGWMSLCLPDDRRAARSLRDKQDAYLAVRREVTRRLSDDNCEAAVKAALDGGYLGLARETRDYCAAPTPGVATTSAAQSEAQVEADEASDD